MVIIDLIMHF